jgi:hypothetical protein
MRQIKHTAQIQSNPLMVTIDQWLGQQAVKVPPEETAQIKQLVTAQELIGWTYFTRGFYTKELHDDFLLSNTPPNNPANGTPSTFFSNLIVLMWTAQTAFWTAYKERRHPTPSTGWIRDQHFHPCETSRTSRETSRKARETSWKARLYPGGNSAQGWLLDLSYVVNCLPTRVQILGGRTDGTDHYNIIQL